MYEGNLEPVITAPTPAHLYCIKRLMQSRTLVRMPESVGFSELLLAGVSVYLGVREFFTELPGPFCALGGALI